MNIAKQDASGVALRRKLRWALAAVIALICLAGVRFYFAGSAGGQFAAIRQAGFPMTAEELNAWYPTPPESENAAVKLMEAMNHRVDARLPEDVPIVGTAALPDRGQPFPASMQKAVAEHIEANAETLALVHEAAKLKGSRYPLDFRQGLFMTLPHLAKVKGLAQLLKLDAVHHASAGDAGRAVRALDSSFAVAHSLASEPILISELVRIACVAITLDGMERVMNLTPLSDAHLKLLAERVAEAEGDGRTAMSRALAGERCMGTWAFRLMPSRQAALSAAGPGGSAKETALFTALRITGLQQRDFRFYLGIMDSMIAAAQSPFPEAVLAAGRADIEMNRRFRSWTGKLLIVSRLILPALTRSIEKEARITAQLRAAKVALAIERYERAHGALPSQLPDLATGFLDRLPEDPFDGQPLQFEKLPRGYRIICPAASAHPNAPIDRKRGGRFVGFTVEADLRG